MRASFDEYLRHKLADPEFAARFARASQEWDVALQIAALREAQGLSQAELAAAAGTTQQTISRVESPSYRRQSRATLERVARALGARLEIRLVPLETPASPLRRRRR